MSAYPMGTRYGSLELVGYPEAGDKYYGLHRFKCTCGSVTLALPSNIKKRNQTDCGCSGVKVGDRNGTFEIIRQHGTESRYVRSRFDAKCACGYVKTVSGTKWTSERMTHNCWHNSKMLGQRFGRLVVIGQSGKKGDNGLPLWDCLCDCGETTHVLAGNLTTGTTQSCGCLAREYREQGPATSTGTLTYRQVHERLYKLKGRAGTYACSHCDARAKDWAYNGMDYEEIVSETRPKGYTYSADPDYYLPLCRACHRRYDSGLVKLASITI